MSVSPTVVSYRWGLLSKFHVLLGMFVCEKNNNFRWLEMKESLDPIASGFCSLPNKNCSLPTEKTKIPMRMLSYASVKFV